MALNCLSGKCEQEGIPCGIGQELAEGIPVTQVRWRQYVQYRHANFDRKATHPHQLQCFQRQLQYAYRASHPPALGVLPVMNEKTGRNAVQIPIA